MADCLGTYHQATRSSNAVVWLYVDNILKSWPTWIWHVPFVRYLLIETVLYHEIGHHIHAVHKPVFEGRENVAEDWEARLGKRFFKARYWYLMPVLYPVAISWRLAKRIKKGLAKGGTRRVNE